MLLAAITTIPTNIDIIATWKVNPTKVGERVSAMTTLLEVARYSFFQRGISGEMPGRLVVSMLLAIVKKPGARQDWIAASVSQSTTIPT
jgi:hypothetical protein